MLKTETNTPAMEKRILRAAREFFGRLARCAHADFEHGQWWISLPSGAQYAVNDTNTGFDFEQVSRGEEN